MTSCKGGQEYMEKDISWKEYFRDDERYADVFKTDVKQVFDFIRCAENKKELFKLVQGDENFRCMEEDAYEVATSYVGAEELITVKDEYRKDGKIDMCQALKELLADERME